MAKIIPYNSKLKALANNKCAKDNRRKNNPYLEKGTEY